jgi:hypothetical protein
MQGLKKFWHRVVHLFGCHGVELVSVSVYGLRVRCRTCGEEEWVE